NHGRAMVPSHGVERNSNLLRHGAVDRSLDRGPTLPNARATPDNSVSASHRKWVIFPRARLHFPVVPAPGAWVLNGCAAPRRAPALSANGYQGTKTRSIPKESELSAGSFLVGRRLLQGGQRRERMAALVIAFRRI